MRLQKNKNYYQLDDMNLILIELLLEKKINKIILFRCYWPITSIIINNKMTSIDNVEFIRNITKQLNTFFSEICKKNYHFQCAAESRKMAEDLKLKQLKKAYRIYKKQHNWDEQEEMGDKQKEKWLSKNWGRMSEEEKMRYLEIPRSAEKKSKKKKEESPNQPPENI